MIIDCVYSDYYVSRGCSNVLMSKMEVPEVRKYRKNRKKMSYSIYVAGQIKEHLVYISDMYVLQLYYM